MKKILLILLCFLLSGCYNYIELDQLAIVSLLAIDYKEDKYEVTIEIRENIKNDENASLIYKGSGYSLDTAIQSLSLSLNKTLYLIDIDVLVLTTDAINYKLDSIIDYLIRENNISINFNMLIDNNIDETIEIIKDKEKIVGKYIYNILESKNNNVVTIKMRDFVEIYLNEFYDLILPIGNIENNEFTINSAALFTNEIITNTIEFDEIEAYNLLKNNNPLSLYKINYNDQYLVFKVITVKTKMNYENDNIIISLKINGIFDEMEKIDLNDKNTINTLIELVKKEINKSIYNLTNTCQKYESDIFGFKKIVYNKTRIKPNNIENINIINKIDIELDRKGFIFDSIGEKYEENN